MNVLAFDQSFSHGTFFFFPRRNASNIDLSCCLALCFLFDNSAVCTHSRAASVNKAHKCCRGTIDMLFSLRKGEMRALYLASRYLNETCVIKGKDVEGDIKWRGSTCIQDTVIDRKW